MDLWFQQHDFFITVEWVFLRQAIANFAVMALAEHLSNMYPNEASKGPWIIKSQITIPCSIYVRMKWRRSRFLEFVRTAWSVLKIARLRNDVSHHFVPLSSSWIGYNPTSKNESHVDIHGFNVPTLFEIGDISPSAHVTCICNSFLLVDMVSLVAIATGDVIDIYSMHPHGSRKSLCSC